MTQISVGRPVTILTGFLGAGKTTFLNDILEKNRERKYAIIENEYGEQGIDGDLIIRPDDSIVELNNGCLCCTLNDNLYDILNELYEGRDDYDEIIIEATGVADPEGLAQPFISHPLIKKNFPLRSIVCLVDAEQIDHYLSTTAEAIKQITFCDVLVINKTDLVSNGRLLILRAQLQELNPLAKILQGNQSDFPEIPATNHEYGLSQEDEPSDLQAYSGAEFPVQKAHSHHHRHSRDINSLSFRFDQPFDLNRLRLRLSVYLNFQSSNLYRLKGLIYLQGNEARYALQAVGNRFDLSPHQNFRQGSSLESVFVFIGKNLQASGIEKMLRSCLAE